MKYVKTSFGSLFVAIFAFSSVSFAKILKGVKAAIKIDGSSANWDRSTNYSMRNTIIIFIIVFFSFYSSVFAYGAGAITSTIKITNGTTGAPTIADNDFFSSVVNIGDLDNDGVNDLGVGAFGDDTGGNRRGALHILFMNSDASIKSIVKIAHGTTNGPVLADNDEYSGFSSAGIGDLDNDGIPDILVGASRDDTGGVDCGAAYIHFMNRNGSIKSTTKITNNTINGPTLAVGDRYGVSAGSLGDLDNDGIPDILVGAYSTDIGGVNRGAFYIHFMNRDGSIKSTVKTDSTTTNGPVITDSFFYGDAVESIGDLDNDGIQDIAVGGFGSIEGINRGTLFIHFMNRNGSIKSTVPITSLTANGPAHNNGDWYGRSVVGLGDLDNDSIPDIAVGADSDDTGSTDRGAVYIHYMNRDGSVKSTVKIVEGTTNGPTFTGPGSGNGSRYGFAVANMGDLNSDGVIDLAVGAFNETSVQKGSVYIHFMTPTPGVTLSKTSLSVSEGGTSDSFTVKLNSKPASNVTISLSSSQVTTSPTSLTFTSSNWNTPQPVTVSAVDDNLVENSHTGTVTLTDASADTDYNNLTSSIGVTITDNDRRTTQIIVPIIPKSVQGKSGTSLGFTINNNTSYTTNKTVTLNMNADTSTVRGYLVSTDPSFVGNTGIKPYVQTDQYTLPEKFGTYTIYLKYYSTTGHFSDVISKTIKYQPVVKVQKKVVKKMVKSTKR